MKKIIVIVILSVLFGVGCEKLKGRDGALGPMGPPGEDGVGSVIELVGPVISDSFSITHSSIRFPANISVYLEDINGCDVELPVYLPPYELNAYYLLYPGRIDIYNAAMIPTIRYRIIIVTE